MTIAETDVPRGITADARRVVQEDGLVVEHTNFQGDYRLLRLKAPAIAPLVQPGQFLHLKAPHAAESLLRRPFSIYQAAEGVVSILYKDIGRGTKAMTFLRPGETLNLIGPLGTGYPLDDRGTLPVLVAGGYGMAALYLLAQRHPRRGVAFFGGATPGDILCVPEFEALGWEVRVTTIDGGLGAHGKVTVAIDDWLAEIDASVRPAFYACGPNAMLKAVGDRAMARDALAWLSMDRNMGCGVGACLTCVQKLHTPEGGWAWARVCREGPVFEMRRIIWDEEGTP